MTYLERYLNEIPYEDTKNSIKLIAEKILKAHLVDGEMKQGEEIGLRIEESLGAAAPAADKPDARNDTLTHGELSPAKQKLFNELKFGRNSDQKGK